jgi:hypothetical protein
MKTQLSAFCFSYTCTGKYSCNNANAKKIDVPAGKTNCPVCGFALMWKRDTTRRIFRESRKDLGFVYEKRAQ